MANRVLRGPTVEVGEVTYPCPDLLDEIRESMEENNADADDVSADLIDLWVKSSDEDRHAMDELLIALCGFRMQKLLEGCMADLDLRVAMEIPDDEG